MIAPRLLAFPLLLASSVASAQVTDAAAEGGKVIESHAVSTFGDVTYGPDFEHLDYVNPDAPKGGEFSTWWAGTFDSFNPYSIKGRSGLLASIAYESMLIGTADTIGESYCLLCETVRYPQDKAWVEFDIRPEARFSDGTPMTAEDVVFSYEIMRDQGLPSFRTVIATVIASAEVVDEDTVRFTFTEDAPMRGRVESAGGLPVFSKAWFDETGARIDESRLEPAIGSGPYALDGYDINQRILYARDEDYWGADLPINVGRNNYDTIRIEYFGDSLAAFEGFKAGAYTFRQENSSKEWATSYGFPAIEQGTVVKEALPDGTIGTGQSYVMNLREPQFQDPRVREALGLLFNFEWSNETLFYGLYERMTSFWENTDLAARGVPTPEEVEILQPLVDEELLAESILTDEAVTPPESSSERSLDRGNLRQASRLLDEAGWEVGDDGLRRKDGETLRMVILEDSPTFDRVTNPYIENLRRAGIDAIYQRVDPAQFTDRERSADFDAVTAQFGTGYEPGSDLVQYFGSETVEQPEFNAMGFGSPAVDRLIQVVRAADTQEELTPAVRALDRVLRAERFWVPQWFNDEYWVAYYDMYRYPEPLPPYSLGQIDFWWIDPEAAEALRASGAL